MKSKRTLCEATDGGAPCTFRKACDTFSLGALMRCLFVSELWPTTEASSLTNRCIMREFQHIEGSGGSLGREFDKGHRCCGPQRRLGPVVHEVISTMKGLQLSDFCLLDDC